MKITIIGPSGSGKSTLSRRISEEFKLPRLEIDRLWFNYGGHNLSLTKSATEEEKETIRIKISLDLQKFISSNESWVIEGTYPKIQPIIANQADTVIYINRPLFKRLLSHLLRIFKNDNRHPETTTWEDIKFTKTIIKRWSKDENEKIENLARMYKDRLVVLRNFREVNTYFESLIDRKKF